MKPGVGMRPLVLGLKSFATSTPLPSDTLSSSKSLPSSLSSGTEGIFDGSFEGAFGRTKSGGSDASSAFKAGFVVMGSGGSGASGTVGRGASLEGFVAFGVVVKSGGNGASSAFDGVVDDPNDRLAVWDAADDDEDSPSGYTALLVVSGGRGPSCSSTLISWVSGSALSSGLSFGLLKNPE